MAILNFPNTRPGGSPLQEGDTYTGDNGVIYTYDGVKWLGRNVAVSANADAIINSGYVVQVDTGGNLVTPSYILPNTVGTTSQVLTWPASGNTLVWTTSSGGGSSNTGTIWTNPANGCLRAELSATGFEAFTDATHLDLQDSGKWNVGSYQNSTVIGNDEFTNTNILSLRSGDETYITTNLRENGNHQWTFGTDGKLTLPQFGAFTSPDYGFSFNKNSGKTGAPEIGTDVTFATEDLNSDIVDGEVYMGSGYGEFRSIYNKVDSTESGLVYAGVEGFNYANYGNVNFAGMVSQTPNIDSMYTVGLNTLSQITIGFTQNGQTQQSNDWSVVVGSLNTDMTVNGLFADTYKTVISGSREIRLTTDRGTVLFGNQPECVPTVASHFHIMRDDPEHVDLFFGDDYNYVKLPYYSTLTNVGVEISADNNVWQFGTDTTLTIPGDIQDANGSVVRVATTSTAPTRVEGQLWFNTDDGRGYIRYDNTWMDLSPTEVPPPSTYLDGLTIDGTTISAIDSTATVSIESGSNMWDFSSTGTLTLPNGSTIGSAEYFSGIPLTTERGTILFGNSPPIGFSSHFHIMKEDPTNVDLFLGDDTNFVKLPTTGGVEITSENTSTWTFGADGFLTFPDSNLQIGELFGLVGMLGGTDAIVGILGQGNSGSVGLEWVDDLTSSTSIAAVLLNNYQSGNVQIQTGIPAGPSASNVWEFGADGRTSFPNYTFQAGDGTAGQVLVTNGSGSVTWTTPIAATGNANTGDFTFVATTLALATDLDMTLHTNGKDWVFGSNGNLTFPDGTVNSGGTVVTGGVYDIQSIGNTLIQTHANATAQTWTFGDDGNLTLPTGGDIRDETSNISVLKTRIGDTYASGAFQQLTIAHDEGKLITIAGGNSVFRLPQMTADMLGAEFEFYFSGDAGQIHIQSYYTGVRETTDVFRGSIYVGVNNATTGKLHKATATTTTACDLFLGQHHAKAESYVKVKAIAFDVVGTWMFQGMCVGDTGQTPNSSDHPFQDYN